MRRLITPVAITTALIAAGALSSASAEQMTPTTTTPRLLSVNGIADAIVRSNSTKALFVSTYRVQLLAALDDASAKATALAAKEGVTLGAIQTITEETVSPTGDCDGPMFADGMVSARAPASTKRAPVKHHHNAIKKTKAKVRTTAVMASDSPENDVYPCDVGATVTVAYAIS